MALTPGTRLAPYEVLAPRGAGGMGEVYPATRLDRDVAQDPERGPANIPLTLVVNWQAALKR